MKQGTARLILGICLFGTLADSKACIICEDVPTPGEVILERLIKEKGRGSIPELREILRCSKSSDLRLKIIAARELGRFGDRESIGLLEEVLLEILAPESTSDFGVFTAAHALRVQAARSLVLMDAGGVWEKIWAGWRKLSPLKQEELPALLFNLNTPHLQEKQLEILRTSRRRSVEFQVIVELRRSGDSRAIPGVEEKVSEWKKLLAEKETRGEKDSSLVKLIRYAEGTIRTLNRRQPVLFMKISNLHE